MIPREYYKSGISLSPRPVEGEDAELRKDKIRRFMVFCKVSDYDVALLYLELSDWDLSAAIESCTEDDACEDHPKLKLGKCAMAKKGPDVSSL